LAIIILSASTDVVDKIVLIELGADDYVTKPFSPRELLARVRAAIRSTRKPIIHDEAQFEAHPRRMRRKHEMPFGAECRRDGTVRFRLWAPKAASVAVHLSELERDFPMSGLHDGWFELVTEARPGTQYQFKIDNQHSVPDPASRFQTSTVHGASEIIDPLAYEWRDNEWHGRPSEEAVIYELHVGTFSREGTFAGAEAKLDYLSDLGITAIELMPLSSFPGTSQCGSNSTLAP